MKPTNLCRVGAWLFAALLISIPITASWAQDTGPTPFDRRCGQCHLLADPGVLVPQRWLDRLGNMGSIDQLTPEQQTQFCELREIEFETFQNVLESQNKASMSLMEDSMKFLKSQGLQKLMKTPSSLVGGH